MKSALNMCQLINRIDKYKRVEEAWIQGKGKTKVFPEKRDSRGGEYQGNRPQVEFSSQSSSIRSRLVNSLFRKPVYQILEKIKNEPYFIWPNKIGGDLSRRNQSLYCHYH